AETGGVRGRREKAARGVDRRAREPARRPRAGHDRRPGARRAASLDRAAGGRTRRLAAPIVREDGLPHRADVDDLPRLQLQPFDLLAGQLRGKRLAVVADQLDAYLEAEMNEAVHHRLLRGAVGLEQELDVVWADERVTQAVDRADERHHELVGGMVVELARRCRLLDA